MSIRRRNLFATSAAALAAVSARPAFAASLLDFSARGLGTAAAGASAANGIEQILSLDRVHTVEIKADPKDLHWLDEDRNHPVTCDVTIDGEKYKDANFSEKGDLGSSTPLAEKSGFNIRFGKDRPKDMKKLVVNNAIQDTTFVHEHTAYEIYRGAGLAAPRTAHGAITLNGQPYGLFVMEEAQDSAYLEKWLGKGNAKGNFYKAHGPVEFADDYLNPLLRGQDEDGDDAAEASDAAKRADLAALADAVNTPDDDAFAGKIRERLDLDNFITHYALDALVASVDGMALNDNNYILYHNPADDRVVILAHGIDQAFDVGIDPLQAPKLKLAQRVRAIPALEAQWRSEMNRIMDQVWSLDVLFARIDQVISNFQSYKPPKERITDEVAEVLAYAPGVKNLLDARRAQWLAQPF